VPTDKVLSAFLGPIPLLLVAFLSLLAFVLAFLSIKTWGYGMIIVTIVWSYGAFKGG